MGYIDDYLEFLSIPSVSALPEHKEDMERAARWLKSRMEKAGIADVKIIPTGGHPVVYGFAKATETPAPTVLIYGHYDTQPADPLDEWDSPPFRPEIRDGKVFARGAADDKGGVFPAVLAVEDAISQGSLPLNVKFLFEGEEEIGSPNLGALLESEKRRFSADVAISVDGGMYDVDTPSIAVGSRGLAALEIKMKGPANDVHSGGYGGAINNPINGLAQLIAGMKDGEGRITVKGFYDDAVEPTDALDDVKIDEEGLRQRAGVPSLFGEKDYSLAKRMWDRPTLDVNGIQGGFQGEGVKTIIPATATCKITCRLVPDQDPEKILSAIKKHVLDNVPEGLCAEVIPSKGGSKPYFIPQDHPVLGVMDKVLRDIFQKEPLVVKMGGTLPIARTILDLLGIHLFFFAMSSPDERAHGPNEFFRLEEFHRLRSGLPKLFKELAEELG